MRTILLILLITLIPAYLLMAQPDQESIQQTIQNHLDASINESNPGILLHIEYPNKNLSWSAASGVSDIRSQSRLRPDQPFRIASVTKPFVACTILRLYEDGRLTLDNPIAKYISATHSALLKKGNYESDQITIRHLLTHSSGLFDHTNADIYLSSILKDPQHRWSRTEQLEVAINYGKPVSGVGETFSYSDTGYILLGEIIEQVTSKSLDEAIQQQLALKRLGIQHTKIESRENPSNQRVHQYLDGVDTYNFDPSIDLYGGGGLVSTTSDLALFFYKLFNHQVFRNRATLDTMLTKINYQETPTTDYRMGIFRININGFNAFTHTGYWGTQVVYLPQLDASIAVNYSQHWPEKGPAPILYQVIAELEQ